MADPEGSWPPLVPYSPALVLQPGVLPGPGRASEERTGMTMLMLQSFPFTNFSNFAFKLQTETYLAGDSAEAIVNDGPGADALGGSDFIWGLLRANVETTDFLDLAGVRNLASFDAGPGRDRLIGTVRVDAEDDSDILVNGVLGGEALIDMGPGNDAVIGTVHARVGECVSIGGAGINLDLTGRFDAGSGRDSLIGTFKVSGGDGLVLDRSQGIRGNINTDVGCDTLRGTVDVRAGDGAFVASNQGIAGVIDTGEGRDSVIGTVKVVAGDDSNVSSGWGIGPRAIETGDGHDKVIGTSTLSVGENSAATANAGIATAVDTGDGNDKVIGKVFVAGQSGSTATNNHGIVESDISTGDGKDRVEGTSSIKGSGLAQAFGDGINGSTITTGDGNDTVVGKGAKVAIDGTSDGIQDTTINLGTGDDTVHARGATTGVENVFIFGEEGDDTFDLHSGTGEVDGGAGEFDLLILSGDKDDFTFTQQGLGVMCVLIDDTGGDVTLLDVDNVELFQFNDGVYAYDQLFV